MAYRYIGKGITDSNGIAHMTEDADGQTVTGYIGTGRGLTDIIASLDDSSKISEGSLQSEIYEVMDYIKYDGATSSDYQDIWSLANTSLDRQSDGTVVTVNNAWGFATLGSTSYFVPINTVIEFDLLRFDTEMLIELRSSVQQSGNWQYCTFLNSIGHIRWEITLNSQKQYVDGVLKRNMAQPLGEAFLFHIGSGTATKTCKIANFKVYPI